VRLMFAVVVGPGDVEFGPPEQALAITAQRTSPTSARRIDLRIRVR